MNCPRCNTQLRSQIREEVVIDLCPSCRGVWLDRGELELILSRNRRDGEDFHRENPTHGRKRPSFFERLFSEE